jgi:tetratricopeptide (TPR) repeat protein
MIEMIRALVVVLLLPCLAYAAPSSQAVKQARAHFAQGKSLQDAGKFDDAIVEYEAAYKLAPLPKLLFNIGQCQRLKGDKQKAIEAYQAYLAASPDDEMADEARDHMASLRMSIQLEQAQEASKRAAADAEAARKQAAEAEAARRRWESEQATRTRAMLDEQERMRRAADEAAEKQRRERADVETAKQRRSEAARNVGRSLRIAGSCIAAGGALIFGLGYTLIPDGSNQKEIIQNETSWTTADDQRVQRMRTDSQAMIAMWTTGVALIVGGSTIGIVGAVKRSRAIDRARERQ